MQVYDFVYNEDRQSTEVDIVFTSSRLVDRFVLWKLLRGLRNSRTKCLWVQS